MTIQTIPNPPTSCLGADSPRLCVLPDTQDFTVSQENSVITEPVLTKDDRETDANTVVINKLIEEQQQVTVRYQDTPTIWRSLPDGNRYAQIPPIYDQDTGVEIQRQMEQEGLTAQKVVGRAIAFSKVPLLVLEVLAGVGSRLLNRHLRKRI